MRAVVTYIGDAAEVKFRGVTFQKDVGVPLEAATDAGRDLLSILKANEFFKVDDAGGEASSAKPQKVRGKPPAEGTGS